MGKADTKSKHYLQQKDVFADAFNYYIYDGKPVITLVILLSPEQWDGPLSIHEMLNVKDEYLLSLVPDYKINLITPYDMDAEKLKKLRSSLREVLEFIKYSEDKERMKKLVSENERYQEMDPKAVSLLNSCTNVKIRIEEKEEL